MHPRETKCNFITTFKTPGENFPDSPSGYFARLTRLFSLVFSCLISYIIFNLSIRVHTMKHLYLQSKTISIVSSKYQPIPTTTYNAKGVTGSAGKFSLNEEMTLKGYKENNAVGVMTQSCVFSLELEKF